jgi:hypothetical protein
VTAIARSLITRPRTSTSFEEAKEKTRNLRAAMAAPPHLSADHPRSEAMSMTNRYFTSLRSIRSYASLIF